MAAQLSRRRVLQASALGVATATLGGCATSPSHASAPLSGTHAAPGPVSVRVGRLRLHLFQTGWVAVKRPHRAYSGPAGLRFPAIMLSRSWTEWLPVTAFVIEHPDGLYLVDTGETARILEPEYVACDAVTGFIYRRNLRFALREEDEIGPQMRRAGLAPESASQVIMTHLHSDHMGGMHHFPESEFLVADAARGGHAGALMCRIPPSAQITSVSMTDEPVGAFSQSRRVTPDGTITVVPTPGHAKGHQSVLLQDDGASVCIAGDAAFTLDQILSEQMAGIVENVVDARQSLQRLKQQHSAFNTVMLPTHDPDNADRLRALRG
ncbi:MAG: N-acyl homoserine lactonase family protein [Pseudomonadota bacterium]